MKKLMSILILFSGFFIPQNMSAPAGIYLVSSPLALERIEVREALTHVHIAINEGMQKLSSGPLGVIKDLEKVLYIVMPASTLAAKYLRRVGQPYCPSVSSTENLEVGIMDFDAITNVVSRFQSSFTIGFDLIEDCKSMLKFEELLTFALNFLKPIRDYLEPKQLSLQEMAAQYIVDNHIPYK